LDLPTQIGLDSDAPMAAGEVGKVGLALDTCDDLLRALETIPLAEMRLATVGNCNSPWILAMFHTLAEANGHDPKDMRFQIQNDPIKEYTGRGTYIFPPSVAIDISSDVTEFICKNLPNWAPQYNCTTTMRWGGSSASQEVGFGIANLLCYIEAAQAKGVDPADFVPRLHLHMSSDNDLFEEVAKFRAVRRLWAKIAGERLKTDDPRILALRTTVYTAGDKLTAQEPLNNITRTTMHVLAALLGGADNIVVPAYDEALALPTFESARVATLIKNILHDECYVGQTADPLGGSYFVESLTTQIEDKAYDWYRQVEDMGGPVAALENGFYLKEMSDGMYRQFTEVETGERTVIGVNKHIRDTETKIDIFKGDPEAEQRQVNRLKEARANRDQTRVTAALAEVRRVAEVKKKGERENIVPSFLEAVRARATIGEIYDELRDVFGVYHAPNVV
jgi:methylmalonyl-CoA mutase N-terminal domain/subunit